MSYPRRKQWVIRAALGLAVAAALIAGRASVVAASIDPGTHGSGYVTAGGWSGLVDLETGIPLSAGIPFGDEEYIDDQTLEVIPYLSHGMLSQEDAQVENDPYLNDVFVRPGESLGGPDGGSAAPRSSLETESSSAKADDQADEPADLEPLELWPLPRDRD